MASKSDMQYSGTMSKLLLPQLLEYWLPDHNAAHHESTLTPLSDHAPELRIPPLISFLEGLPDVVTPNDSFPGKRFPCGHIVDLRPILACCNLFGDEIWKPGPHSYGCTEPGCSDTNEFPKIPDPRTLDGLQARLDLIEWSWQDLKPTQPERNVVSLLRDNLSRTGHQTPDPEPETHNNEALQPNPSSTSSPKETFSHAEIEAFCMTVADEMSTTEPPVRGTQPYCSYRAWNEEHSQLQYPMLSPGQECECAMPHEHVREARYWGLTPAESDPDDHHRNGDEEPMDNEEEEEEETSKPKPKPKRSKNKISKSKPKPKNKNKKSVHFPSPFVVTEVRYFEPWWCAEYRDSDRYYSTGPQRLSTDPSTSADDEWEIEMLDDPRKFTAAMLRDLKDGVVMEESGSESESESDDDETEEEIVAREKMELRRALERGELGFLEGEVLAFLEGEDGEGEREGEGEGEGEVGGG